jgi:hypothetical protein
MFPCVRWMFTEGGFLNRNVAPRREDFVLLYSISFFIFHIRCYCFKERLGTFPSRTNSKARSPVTHIATANRLKLQKTLLGEYRKC